MDKKGIAVDNRCPMNMYVITKEFNVWEWQELPILSLSYPAMTTASLLEST